MRVARQPASDQGETLIELIIAIAIMGIAIVAIVSGIATSILMSDVHRKEASAGAYVRDDAEALVTVGYKPNCAYSVPASPATGYAATITGTYYWDGSTFVAGCSDTGVHKVTIQVATSSDTRASERLDVIIRNPS